MKRMKNIFLRLAEKVKRNHDLLTEARIKSLREFHNRDPESFFKYVNTLEESHAIMWRPPCP